jgi:hypothetical protein
MMNKQATGTYRLDMRTDKLHGGKDMEEHELAALACRMDVQKGMQNRHAWPISIMEKHMDVPSIDTDMQHGQNL